MDALSHDALSHLANMTLKKRREWARVFIGANHHGLSRPGVLLFSVECARQLGSAEPLLVALRVVTRGRRGRSAWHMPPRWAPRAVGALAVGIALWGVFCLHPNPIRVEPPVEGTLPEDATTDWLTRDGGVIAVPMPTKRLERQQAPPCASLASGEEEINGGCWIAVNKHPPCGQFYEHAGKCYVPVRETPRPPTSVDL